MGISDRTQPEAVNREAMRQALDALHEAGELHMRALIAINAAKDSLEAALMRSPIQHQAQRAA